MPLSIGTRLGPYEILAPLGTGGMGEVFRARDPRMGRDVAIKIAAEQFNERLSREAHAVAALNHPNICHIYDVGPDYLVMELVEGPTLAERIASGKIPLEEALHIARQIAEALEAAHEKGVVHRDLKPANVKVKQDGLVKVLDFGLAKMAEPPESAGRSENSPTLTIGAAATRVGTILGTAAYMAPEQARGKIVDKRADIWAFGVVLYEMLTGRRLFDGETFSDTLIEVATKEPEWTQVPAKVRRLLRRCLEKDPKRRLRDIGEAWFLLEDAPAPVPAPSRSRFAAAGWIAAALLAVAAAATGYFAWRHFTEDPPLVTRTYVLPPEKSAFPSAGADLAISPDGRHLAFLATLGGTTAIWVRDLDSLTPRMLPGTGKGILPFWSADSRSIGFFASGKLKKIGMAGGPVVTLCDAPAGRGGTWNKNGIIVFAPAPAGGLFSVPAAGGIASPVTELDKTRHEFAHLHPWFLPDDRHFLFSAGSRDSAKTAVFVGDLDSKKRVQAIATASNAVYAAPGYLLFLRDRTLMAQPFNAARLQATGEAVPIAEQVDYLPLDQTVFGGFRASQNGVLVYTSGALGGEAQIAWFDRSGKAVGTDGPPGNMQWASLSPDGSRVVTDLLDPQTGNRDLWIHDLSRGTTTRLTFTGSSQYPIWSPDGIYIAFAGQRDGVLRLYQKAAANTGPEEVLEDDSKRPDDWSRDGRYLISETRASAARTLNDIWIHPFFGDKKPFPWLQTEFAESMAKLSPDGQWLAYQSNESKRAEIYVVSFPKPGGKWQISTNGGVIPVWSRDGRELYFISADRKMMAVEIKPGTRFEAGIPKPLFDVRLAAAGKNFDVSKDGRFLIPTRTEQPGSPSITVVVNWAAGLKR